MKVTESPDGTVTVDTGKGSAAKAAATWDGESVAGVLLKSEPERRFTLMMGYPAMKADVEGGAADGHRDFAGQAAVEDAAWAFMKSGAAIGLGHADGTDGAGQTVESYVYRGPDWTIKAADGSECTVVAGDWLVGIVWSEAAWKQVQEGRIGGGSMQGTARRAKPSADKVAALRS